VEGSPERARHLTVGCGVREAKDPRLLEPLLSGEAEGIRCTVPRQGDSDATG